MSDYMSAIAEIERLNAEIERLKEENAHYAWRDTDKNRIITELVAALEECGTKPFVDLKGRAGKAVRGY